MQGTGGRKEHSVPPAGGSETSATRAGRLALTKEREGRPEWAGASPKATLSPVLPWDGSNSKLSSPCHQQGRVWKKEPEEGPGASQLGRGRSLVSLPLCSWRRPHPASRPYSLPVEDEERRCPQAAPAPSMGRGGAGGGELRASGSGGGGGGGGSSLDALESAEQPLCTWFPGSSAASSLWAMPGRAASGSPGLRPSWR